VSFQGTLDLFGLADILRLLAASGKDGLLALRRDGASGGIWLVDGGVAWAETRPGPAPLARRLLGLGAVEPDAMAAALREAAEGGSLAALLEQSGAVAAERLREVAREHLAEELFDLARWPDGSFSFEQGTSPPESLDPAVAVDELLAETERRLAAWPEIAGKVPGRSALLSIPPRPADAGPTTVDPAEWRLLAAVGGSRTVASLVEETGQGEFQTCQALAAMVERGLLAVSDEAADAGLASQRPLHEALAATEPEAAVGPEVAVPAEAAGVEADAAEGGPGGDAAGPAPAPGPGAEADSPRGADPDAAEAMLERLISGVRGL
jgi:hypothetical protein